MTSYSIKIELSFNLGNFISLCSVNATDEASALKWAKANMWRNGVGMVKRTARAEVQPFNANYRTA